MYNRTLVAPVLGIGFEYSAEMTYPIPEQVSAGILNLTAMVSTHQMFGCHA